MSFVVKSAWNLRSSYVSLDELISLSELKIHIKSSLFQPFQGVKLSSIKSIHTIMQLSAYLVPEFKYIYIHIDR